MTIGMIVDYAIVYNDKKYIDDEESTYIAGQDDYDKF